MMKAAVSAARAFPDMKIVALTLVTGLDKIAMSEIGWHGSPMEQVIRLTRLALESGRHGVIASAREARQIREAVPADFLIVTPGIRPVDVEEGDQVRTGTPTFAVRQGATHLVVGRPIIQAEDPAKAARQVLAEMVGAV